MSDTWPTNTDLHREHNQLLADHRETMVRLSELRREFADFKDHVGANLASLNELAAELTAEVAKDPEFTKMTVGVLRALTFNLGWQFRGETRPGDWDPDLEYRRLAGDTEADKPGEPVRKLEECWAPADEPDEPEPQEYDPGPEIDDQGGMSEHRYLITEDDRERG